MAEPITNRVTLRREICRDLGMPFFRRWPNGIAVQDTATSHLKEATDAGAVRDSRFNQRRDYWNKQWIYDVGTGESRAIVDFLRDSKTLIPEYDFDVAPDTATTIEIFAIHTPEEVHTAINDAIIEGFPVFFDVVTDETIIFEENKREYDLVTQVGGRGVLSNPLRIKSIWAERTASGSTFVQDTASTTTSVVNVAAGFTAQGLNSDWSIGVYAGTGAGQYTEVVSAEAHALEIAAFTIPLDTTSQIRYWNRTNERYAWDPITAINFDSKDYPSKMYMLEDLNYKRGLRFRIQYVGEPQSLTTDTAAGTVVPKKYIKHFAIAKLLRQRARRLPGEAAKYTELAQMEQVDADKFKMEHSFDLPDQTMWTEEHYGGYDGQSNTFDPLG